jgi:hypothetical protein
MTAALAYQARFELLPINKGFPLLQGLGLRFSGYAGGVKAPRRSDFSAEKYATPKT